MDLCFEVKNAFFLTDILHIQFAIRSPQSQHLSVVLAMVYVSVPVMQILLGLHSARSGNMWGEGALGVVGVALPDLSLHTVSFCEMRTVS